MTLPLLRRYMLVDSEEDKKTHRPVAPKDVSLPLVSSLKRTCVFTVANPVLRSTGPQEISALPRQPGGHDERRAISTREEERDGGNEEDLCESEACQEIQVPLMAGAAV